MVAVCRLKFVGCVLVFLMFRFLDYWRNERQLAIKCLKTEVASYRRHIRTSIIVSFDALAFVKRSKPVLLKKVRSVQWFQRKTFNWCGNPDIKTEFLAISDMSTEFSFQTWQATEYSSISGSFVRWNCSGSSVERAIFWPLSKNSENLIKPRNL